MNSNYSIEQIHELLRRNEKNKRYFTKKISPRFSDCIYDKKIHLSKFLEFFEMSRFDVMQDFYDFVSGREGRNRRASLGNFIVVRLQCDSYEALNAAIERDIQVKTVLILHQKPLLEFEQTAFECGNHLPLIKANIKIAIVDDTFAKAEEWEQEILSDMIEFINIYGKEEEI